VTKAGLYPLIDVKAALAPDTVNKFPGTIEADVTVQFAGQTVKFSRLKLLGREVKPGEALISGVLPLKLKDFKIQAPSLLTMPVQDEVPVNLELYWKRVDSRDLKKN